MVKGYGFKKGEVFDRLKDYWGLNWRKDVPVVRLKNKKISYPALVQPDLLDRKKSEVVRYREGDYFELLSQARYGGVRKYQRDLSDNTTRNTLIHEADLIDHKNCWAREVKGIASGKGAKLDDGQIPKYIVLQVGDYFPRSPEIRFEIFVHSIKHLIKGFSHRPLEELVFAFSKNILYHISFPFSLIWHLYDLNKPGYTSRQDDIKHRQTYTRFLGSTVDRFLADPFKTIEEVGLDPDRYLVEGARWPDDSFMNGELIIPFPSLTISDVDHTRFVEESSRRDLLKYISLLAKYGVKVENLLINGRKAHGPHMPDSIRNEGDTDFPFGSNA
ncbi:hypothetical protein HY212_06400 [Candidatus Pacearchaeota archaeon]|nr:hypothetical protein [Candidatus Pacearchaeota archaeon]